MERVSKVVKIRRKNARSLMRREKAEERRKVRDFHSMVFGWWYALEVEGLAGQLW
jgi:hypothetical protein